MLTGIIFLVLLLVVMGIAFLAYIRLRNKVREVSRTAFGTDNIVEGFKQAELDAAMTPKSISAATNLYLPQIMRDFPQFQYDEMRTRAENVLTSYLRAVDEQKVSLLTEGTSELRDELQTRIHMLQNQEEDETFKNVKIHRTEIAHYRKAKGRCSVVFQTAVEYIHYTKKDGKIVRGKEDLRQQAKYDIEVIYIQDRDYIENISDMALAPNCPNCGAPLPQLGAKFCQYCNSPILEFNIRTWNFCKVTER